MLSETKSRMAGKIQYCSDLHLEFRENKNFLKHFPINPEGEILLLAGDIVLFKLIKEHDDFFNFCADNFEATYWIPGNHEYYDFDLADVRAENFQPLFEKIKENVFLLNNQTIKYKNADLVFSTLWSHIPPQYEWTVQQNVSDFEMIKKKGKNLTAPDFNALHKNDLNFLKTALSTQTDRQRIVITHHVPTLMHYPEQYRNSSINSAFAVELHDFIFNVGAGNFLPLHWIYGHHHYNTPAFKIGNTTMLTNQLGYVRQNEHRLFNSAATIEI
jgi:predicted phosphohydrolase